MKYLINICYPKHSWISDTIQKQATVHQIDGLLAVMHVLYIQSWSDGLLMAIA